MRLLMIDNYDEIIDNEHELGFALPLSGLRLRATREGGTLPLRTAVLLPWPRYTNITQKVAHKLVGTLFVTHYTPHSDFYDNARRLGFNSQFRTANRVWSLGEQCFQQ